MVSTTSTATATNALMTVTMKRDSRWAASTTHIVQVHAPVTPLLCTQSNKTQVAARMSSSSNCGKDMKDGKRTDSIPIIPRREGRPARLSLDGNMVASGVELDDDSAFRDYSKNKLQRGSGIARGNCEVNEAVDSSELNLKSMANTSAQDFAPMSPAPHPDDKIRREQRWQSTSSSSITSSEAGRPQHHTDEPPCSVHFSRWTMSRKVPQPSPNAANRSKASSKRLAQDFSGSPRNGDESNNRTVSSFGPCRRLSSWSIRDKFRRNQLRGKSKSDEDIDKSNMRSRNGNKSKEKATAATKFPGNLAALETVQALPIHPQVRKDRRERRRLLGGFGGHAPSRRDRILDVIFTVLEEPEEEADAAVVPDANLRRSSKQKQNDIGHHLRQKMGDGTLRLMLL